MPSGRFDFAQSRLSPSTPLCSVSLPLPSARSPRGGRLPAAQPRRPTRRPRARRAPACSPFRNLSAPSRTHPRCFPAVAPAFAPRRAISAPVARAAPSPRVPGAAVGDPSVRGKRYRERGLGAQSPSEPLRGAAERCRAGVATARAGRERRPGAGRAGAAAGQPLPLSRFPVGWHGSPGRRGETFLVREF